MTKKDYIVIARQLKNTLENIKEYESVLRECSPVEVFESIVKDLGIMLKSDNERFDYVRFYQAVGIVNK